jgi:hypothetical protein
MGGACSTNGNAEKCTQNFSQRPEGKIQLEDRGHLNEQGFEEVDWIHMAQDADHCWAFVNTVMNSRVL